MVRQLLAAFQGYGAECTETSTRRGLCFCSRQRREEDDSEGHQTLSDGINKSYITPDVGHTSIQ